MTKRSNADGKKRFDDNDRYIEEWKLREITRADANLEHFNEDAGGWWEEGEGEADIAHKSKKHAMQKTQDARTLHYRRQGKKKVKTWSNEQADPQTQGNVWIAQLRGVKINVQKINIFIVILHLKMFWILIILYLKIFCNY